MTKTKWMLGAAFGAVMAGAMTVPAAAQDSVFMPLLTYRTGAFAGSGIAIADGMRDYLEMINQRDGGINGVKIGIEECETGYDTKKGVECYEALKSKNPLIVSPYSTGITLQLIPRAAVDKVVVLSMAYGLSASADGSVFPWVFNPPATYWDGASVMVSYMASREGGLDKLKGKKLGLIHLDAPFGKEPIPVLEAMAKQYGFEVKLYPIAAADMQNQGATWLNIRRDRVDYIYNQGWGTMNPTAVKEAIKNSFPIDKLVGVWWAGGDEDALQGAELAPGGRELPGHSGHRQACPCQGTVEGGLCR
jgi:branched-chain amino acid transport system substrate-binding protein